MGAVFDSQIPIQICAAAPIVELLVCTCSHVSALIELVSIWISLCHVLTEITTTTTNANTFTISIISAALFQYTTAFANYIAEATLLRQLYVPARDVRACRCRSHLGSSCDLCGCDLCFGVICRTFARSTIQCCCLCMQNQSFSLHAELSHDRQASACILRSFTRHSIDAHLDLQMGIAMRKQLSALQAEI